MCTCATYATKDHYFGRNLDLEYSYHETVTVTPRNFPLPFRKKDTLFSHYALIGMAFVNEGYPLYYDATNEFGLSMAGLNFPGNGYFRECRDGVDNITPFEFIPWILGQCKNLEEARKLLARINLVSIPFSEKLPITPLHWMIADQTGQIVVESVRDGIHIYDNPTGVMTNNPTFDHQLFRLNDYRGVSAGPDEDTFAPGLSLDAYSRGMGGIGLPGDLSSGSRFVKVAFTRLNSVSGDDESASISQFFHILGSVEQQRGCCRLGRDSYEITIYSSCCNMDRGIYYYTTYENSQISAVDMHHEDLDSKELATYPLVEGQQINWQN
ncbi:MAG: choloylglycine hydrolase [Candidatus Weimeria sp.]